MLDLSEFESISPYTDAEAAEALSKLAEYPLLAGAKQSRERPARPGRTGRRYMGCGSGAAGVGCGGIPARVPQTGGSTAGISRAFGSFARRRP